MTALAWDDKPSQVSRRERTVDILRRGGLAAPSTGKTWVGRGSGQACSGCGDMIPAEESEYELEFVDGLTFRFHVECWKAWSGFDRGSFATMTS